MTAPAFADGHLRIVDEPLELTIHMHWPRAQGYGVGGDTSKTIRSKQAAREMTGIHLSRRDRRRATRTDNSTRR